MYHLEFGEMARLLEHVINLLGHPIQIGKLESSMKATDAISGLQHSKNVKECKSFLGLRNVFQGLYRYLHVQQNCSSAIWKRPAFALWTTE